MAKPAPDRLSPQEALAAIACHCIEMDGMVTAEEHDALRAALGQVALMGSAAQVREALRHVGERIRVNGAGPTLEMAIHSIPPAWRPHAYNVATRLVGADGDVAAEDSALLQRLRREFKL